MNKNLIFKSLTVLLCCTGIMSILNTFSDISQGQDTNEHSVSITADITSGTPPLEVSFTSTINDPFAGKYPITYDWHFYDGAASTKKNPQHTFTEPGEYHVICRVTFWKSPKVTVEADVNINVTEVQPLALSISANPTSGNAPLTVNFTSTVTGGSSGDKIVYKWVFGDGTTSIEINPTHTFNTAGTFNVTCTVTGGTPSQAARDTIDIEVTQPSWPAAVCTADGHQLRPQIASDGSGGAIITWQDFRSGNNTDIYARRIDSVGNHLWSENGVAICTAGNDQYEPQIIPDDSGGAIISWYDSRGGNYDIYAQRIDRTGNPQWTVDGMAICNADSSQNVPQITSDGSGGAIITWQDSRSDNYDIYAQRIDSTGKVLWSENGVVICTETNSQSGPQISSDGSGGAIITWQDNRSGNYDIYARRIDSTGKVLWSENGVVICMEENDQRYPRITSDGSGGAVITWQDSRSGNYDIYARRIDSSGKVLWSENGVAICTAANNQLYPRITSDGSGGVVITWNDNRSGNYDIYAQRIDSTGKLLWTADGVLICKAVSDQLNPNIIPDGSGGAIITWEDKRSGSYFDIYAGRISNIGEPMWTENGMAICTVTNDQRKPQITFDGSGGAIITWEDNRSGNIDIYAQRITKDGELK